MAEIIEAEKVRVPFLIAVKGNLYVHFSTLFKAEALKAFGGKTDGIKAQLETEIRKTAPTGDINIHGMLPWGSSMDTVSISEVGIFEIDIPKSSDFVEKWHRQHGLA